jgi:phage terminase large subunit-like protein
MTTASSWKADRLKLLEQQAAAKRQNRLKSFQPYERQLHFFEVGTTHRERLLMAGNQTGKTYAGAFEMAVHLTGEYPDWWPGKRFDHPVKAWAAGEGGNLVRDVIQARLCGTPGSDADFGTGMIPKSLLEGKSAGHGVSDLLDSIRVKHVSGGTSTLTFKSYEAGRSKFQGASIDVMWLDEEAPEDVYNECLARLTGDGIIYTTFTPLKGYSNVVGRFLRDTSPEARRDRYVVKMGLRHAEHFTEEQKARRLAGYKAHERAARENGDPLLGSGAVFEEVIESDISMPLALSQAPAHWAYLWGIDFGIGHPFAAVLIGWDRDTDTIYVLDCFKLSGGIPVTHASRIKAIARDVPVAWPHDGSDREKGSGEPLANIYKREGLNMLRTHATHPDGGYSTEAGITEMLGRMRTGCFKVAAHLVDWFDEFRTYHRKEGLIIKLNDDLLSATRIAVMDRRHAKALPNPYTGIGAAAKRRQASSTVEPFDVFTGRPIVGGRAKPPFGF